MIRKVVSGLVVVTALLGLVVLFGAKVTATAAVGAVIAYGLGRHSAMEAERKHVAAVQREARPPSSALTLARESHRLTCEALRDTDDLARHA